MRGRVLNKTSYPAIPYFYAYDKNGEQVFGAAPAAPHTWDTVEIRTSEFSYNAGDDTVIYLGKTDGFYRITHQCSYMVTEEGYDNVFTMIYVNGEMVRGALSVSFGFDADYFWTFTAIDIVTYLNKGDEIQVMTYSGGGNDVETHYDSDRIIIEHIPMKGWNNSTGGNVIRRRESYE